MSNESKEPNTDNNDNGSWDEAVRLGITWGDFQDDVTIAELFAKARARARDNDNSK